MGVKRSNLAHNWTFSKLLNIRCRGSGITLSLVKFPYIKFPYHVFPYLLCFQYLAFSLDPIYPLSPRNFMIHLAFIMKWLLFYVFIYFFQKRSFSSDQRLPKNERFLYIAWEICDALRDLVPSVQFKKRKPSTLLKVTLLHGCFSHFLNCTNDTKSL